MATRDFTLDDFMAQMEAVRNRGSMDALVESIPGARRVLTQANMSGRDVERQMDRMQAICESMTMTERRNPDLVDGQRQRRIARGAGVEPGEVDQVMKQFRLTRKMMRAVDRWRW